MKKYILLVALIGLIALCGGCNKDLIDTSYKFNYAYIQLQTGEVVQGEVEGWTDFEDGDQLQIRMNGKTYLVHSVNCTLIYDPSLE